MNPNDYTPEQKVDIEARTEKAKLALKKLELQPACFVTPINVGDDVFGLKPIAFLQDLRYAKVVSPIQMKDL